jgi:2-methylcitrate dehydratase PrpD
MAGLTRDLAEFVATCTLAKTPFQARAVAKTGMTDCFGVLVAGSREPLVRLLDRELAGADGVLASLIPSGEKRNSADAALVNGAAAHVLDYDDVTLDGHPSAVLLPAILAQAEVSKSTGAEMLTAYIVGYEVWSELLSREPTPLHEKGWHPTGVRGVVAAAAACAKLRRLDPDQIATALAIAGSMAAGLVANFGTLTKPFQVGRAAQAGVIAARLAQAGLTASADALEHPSGYLAAFSPNRNADLTADLNRDLKEWRIVRQGLHLKRYPLCYAAHRSIDATLDLAERYDLKPDDVQRILVFTGQTQLTMLRNERPQAAFEAKFSMPFALAAALVARHVGLKQLTDDFVKTPTVQSLFPRVGYETTTDALDGSAFAPFDAVEIVTKDGTRRRSEDVRFAKGSYQRPLSREELWVKFSDCLGDGVSDSAKSQSFETLQNLEGMDDVRSLLKILTGEPR